MKALFSTKTDKRASAPALSRNGKAKGVEHGVLSVLASLLLFLFITESPAATAAEYVLLGRASLSQQTPSGLHDALGHFDSALSVDSENLEANFLKAITLLALEQGSADFQQQLSAVGVTVTDPNLYNFEYQIPVDAEGRLKPADAVMSDATLAYLNGQVSPLLDEALACLAKFANNTTSRAFRIRLNAVETSLAEVRIDYGDVLILRSLLKGAKAGLALANSYNLSAEYALFYRLFISGQLTPERVLSELPELLKFSSNDQRSLAKSTIVAANTDYQSGYAFTKSQRLPGGTTPYLFEFPEPSVADNFATELAIIAGNLAAGSETYLYQAFYPTFLQGLTVNTASIFSSPTPPRSFLGAQFNQGYPTRSSWPDESFGAVLPDEYSRGILLDELDYVMGQLIDSDGDGLSDSWERGYGRYEVVKGQFTADWATWDAQSRGGHLATFTSLSEWDWFWKRHWREVDGPLYLGLFSDGQQPANWTWTTGENGTFQNWAPGQPMDDGIQTTAVMDQDLTWRSLRPYQGYYWDPMTWMSVTDLPPEEIGYVLERGYPTDHTIADTDSDGFNDRVETVIGTDPNNPEVFPSGPDMDGDGVNNYREDLDGTDPLDPASFDSLSSGLVAHYPFTGDAKDESGFGRDGNVFSATLDQDRFGLADRAYSFDGFTSYIATSAVVSQYGSAATFSAWVRVSSDNPYAQGAILSQAKDPSATGLRLGMQGGHAEAAISNPYYMPGYYYWSPSIYTAQSPSMLADGEWRHLVLVSEGWATRLFVNGYEVASTYNWTGGQASLQGVLIGKEFESYMMPNSANFFSGQIDDVRVYDRALSSAEVSELFARESAPLTDTDGDGLPDAVETNTGTFVSRNNTGTDPNNPDSDGDGLLDGVESNTGLFSGPADTGSNPNISDSNTDGISDGEAVSGGFDPAADLAPAIAWLTGLIEMQPGRFNLMTTDAIMDLNVGSLMLQRLGTDAVLRMQIQTTVDLVTQPFSDHGDPIDLTIPMPSNKGFLRVNFSGGATLVPSDEGVGGSSGSGGGGLPSAGSGGGGSPVPTP